MRLLGLMEVGLREQTTIPSPVKGISELGRTGMESPSGSVELRRHYAGNVVNYAR